MKGIPQPDVVVQIQSKDRLQVFHMKPIAAKIGFSDTAWFGRDHFSLCHHIDGMRAIVRYKPLSNSEYAGEFWELELRVDPALPASLPNSSQQSAAQK